eukprot:gene5753-11628_t
MTKDPASDTPKESTPAFPIPTTVYALIQQETSLYLTPSLQVSIQSPKQDTRSLPNPLARLTIYTTTSERPNVKSSSTLCYLKTWTKKYSGNQFDPRLTYLDIRSSRCQSTYINGCKGERHRSYNHQASQNYLDPTGFHFKITE